MVAKTVVTITGPSASGKSTLERYLTPPKPLGFVEYYRTISHTTRPPRSSEVRGVDYHFVDDQELDTQLASGRMLECVEFSGFRYGVAMSEVEHAWEHNKIPLIVCDFVGLKQIRSYCQRYGMTHLAIYLSPDDAHYRKEIKQRFIDRTPDMNATLNETQICARFAKFILELDEAPQILDYLEESASLDTVGLIFRCINQFDLVLARNKVDNFILSTSVTA